MGTEGSGEDGTGRDWFFTLTQWTGTEGIGRDRKGWERNGADWFFTAHNGVDWRGPDWIGRDRIGGDWLGSFA